MCPRKNEVDDMVFLWMKLIQNHDHWGAILQFGWIIYGRIFSNIFFSLTRTLFPIMNRKKEVIQTILNGPYSKSNLIFMLLFDWFCNIFSNSNSHKIFMKITIVEVNCVRRPSIQNLCVVLSQTTTLKNKIWNKYIK